MCLFQKAITDRKDFKFAIVYFNKKNLMINNKKQAIPEGMAIQIYY